jgi:GTP cyclohydrolase IB
MNASEKPPIPQLSDMQSSLDQRQLAIQRVGIKHVRYPMTWLAQEQRQATVGVWNFYVALPATQKGTHMSRFIAILQEHTDLAGAAADWSVAQLHSLGAEVLARLQTEEAQIEVSFPLFLRKQAPVTGVASLMDYQLTWTVLAKSGQPSELRLQVLVPVTSLCPCSRDVADYGAHNQRSHVTVSLTLADLSLNPETVIRAVEKQASSELYGLLKRPDEKFITEYAYDHPKFVEDLVRDVALALQQLPGAQKIVVEAENFESIHNHSAFARLEL